MKSSEDTIPMLNEVEKTISDTFDFEETIDESEIEARSSDNEVDTTELKEAVEVGEEVIPSSSHDEVDTTETKVAVEVEKEVIVAKENIPLEMSEDEVARIEEVKDSPQLKEEALVFEEEEEVSEEAIGIHDSLTQLFLKKAVKALRGNS
jgi:hypothetical protein